ncbi:MAG: undecaprenyldiphospho-muramoylpentapeptide beta-N-acetylglucosaminyltransferase [Alphaproteobacteria bacterium]|nr:undecaprenyldiphospho-muramoylpentapeptide beta-N-acetylglucosaminyltransferase [Alphaproteobacteria bacterium]
MHAVAKRIILSAGGTGGHLTPAFALAHDLRDRGYTVHLVMDRRGGRYGLPVPDGITVHTIHAGTLGRGIIAKIKGLAGLAAGLVQARILIARLKPSVVVGFGGYPSFPALRAAQSIRIPTVIHQSDAVLGKANAMLAPRTDRIALSWPDTKGLADDDAVRAVVTGNPVRPEISALYNKPYPPLDDDGPIRLFVTGGSLGAHIFAAVVPGALARLSESVKTRLDVTQQCRAEDLEQVRTAYEAAGIAATCETFFNDVHERLSAAHLFIGRSGASTVSEIAVVGRPAIFVPYPHHVDRQQTINAESLAREGGAWIIAQEDFTEETLSDQIGALIADPQKLFHAAEAARSCGKPDAARRLGNLVTALASGWDR